MTSDVEVKIVLYGPDGDTLIPVADSIRTTFGTRTTISPVKMNRDNDGFHIFMSIFIRGGSKR
jgi:hypothetical protein